MSRQTKAKKPLSAKARRVAQVQRLMMAMDRCAVARGEAQWTKGYRTGAVGVGSSESQRLYDKEQAQWANVGRVENAYRRLVTRILRECAP